MATTKEDIRQWINDGAEYGRQKGVKITHMFVVLDEFEYTEYPVFVFEGEDVGKKIHEVEKPGTMTSIAEVYSYAKPIDEQLNKPRAWNI